MVRALTYFAIGLAGLAVVLALKGAVTTPAATPVDVHVTVEMTTPGPTFDVRPPFVPGPFTKWVQGNSAHLPDWKEPTP
jgi:hypothetical protein